ncbi:MAG: hypothetical protein IT163_20500 [Bryobacterales bacterium]|nr:hypothetical protein [Bryobacterales bacterium]
MPTRPLSRLLEEFESVRARERGEMARLLHDDTGGKLTAAGIELTLLRMDAPPEWASRLDALEQALEAAFASVRGASLLTAPDLAERISLADALARMAEAAGRRFDGTLTLSIDTGYRPEPPAARALFRIAELLTVYFTGEAGATVLDLTLFSGPELTLHANVEIQRRDAARALPILLARYQAAQTNLRFLFGNPSPGSTIFTISS